MTDEQIVILVVSQIYGEEFSLANILRSCDKEQFLFDGPLNNSEAITSTSPEETDKLVVDRSNSLLIKLNKSKTHCLECFFSVFHLLVFTVDEKREKVELKPDATVLLLQNREFTRITNALKAVQVLEDESSKHINRMGKIRIKYFCDQRIELFTLQLISYNKG